MKKSVEIEKMITMSTAHITIDTNNMLIRASNPSCTYGLTVYLKDDYGFFVFVPDEEQFYTEGPNIPEDLKQCLMTAKKHDCRWLCLDADGSEVEGLVVYEW